MLENRDAKVVKQEDVGKYWVSTVWLGMDHGFGGKPMIFETMVFDKSRPDMPPLEDVMNPDVDTNYPTRWTDLYQERYSTEEEAIAGHDEIVNKLKEGTLDLYEQQS